MAGWQDFAGLNRGYVLELYEKYRNDPASVDPETRAMFEQWTPPAESAAVPDGVAYDKIVGAARLAQSIRRYGHLAAKLDPLGLASAESVIRRCCRKPTTSPKTICGGCRRRSFPRR